ncbi:MAG TPA: Mur ligase family protein, partial [Treponemataceae bacterium]|nr:Mur ligase family protein [Treponemataceae bacterium]
LNTTLNFEKRPVKGIFWLKTMEFLCNRFDNPQNDYLTFHVAGSKGKGSVSCFISSILDAAGKKCGLFTSPHVSDLRERVGRSDGFFSNEIYNTVIKNIVPSIDSIIPDTLPGKRDPTWFELLTLFSFMCFKQAQVDCAVFETGMGGRLDSTNIILPECCCLTPIELEHCDFLGNTLEKIAAEKAGIIKQDTPVFSAIQTEGVKSVFKTIAAKKNAPLYFVDEIVDFIKIDNPTYSFKKRFSMRATLGCSKYFSRPLNITLQMPGEFQVWNAALAAITVKSRFPKITEKQIEKGIALAKLPGRFEVCRYNISEHNLAVVFDGAHTVASIQLTLENFYTYFGQGGELLFACAADKKIDKMAEAICSSNCQFNSITLTRPGENKNSNYDSMVVSFSKANTAKKGHAIITLSANQNFEQAITNAINSAAFSEKPLLVCGSFYLIFEVKKILQKMISSVA